MNFESGSDTAVCLIQMNNVTSKFEVTQEGIDFLRTIKKNIVVVSAIGSFRLGKSTLLNRGVLDLDPAISGIDGFLTSPTSKSCTKGLILSKIVKTITLADGKEYALLTIDVEGSNSLEAKASFQYDLCIFALSCLCSDVILYNSQKTIDEASIEKLGLTLEITKKIRTSKMAHGSTEVEEESGFRDLKELSQHMPAFIWVVRDSLLDLVDESNQRVDASNFLETCWQDQEGGTTSKNRNRKGLRTCYPRRDCVLMGMPTLDERKLKKVNSIPFNELNESFKKGLSDLKYKIRKLAQPKRIRNALVDGAGFAELIIGFTNGINNDSNNPLNLDDLHTSFSKQQIQHQYDKIVVLFNGVVKTYRDKFTARKKTGIYFVNPAELSETLEEEISNLLGEFRNSVSVDLDLITEYENKMRTQFQELLIPIYEFNLLNINTWLQNNLNTFEKFVSESANFNAIVEEFKQLYQKVLHKLGESDAVQGIWWKDNNVGEKIWIWMNDFYRRTTQQLHDKLAQTQIAQEELIELKRNYELQTVQLNSKNIELENLQRAIDEVKQIAEVDYAKLKEEFEHLTVNHASVAGQRLDAENRAEELHRQLKETIQEHGLAIAEKERLICEQVSLLNECKAKIESLSETIEIQSKELQALQEEMSGIEIWRNEIQELKDRQIQLQRENDQYRNKCRNNEEEYRNQFETMEQEYVQVIEENKRHFDAIEMQLKQSAQEARQELEKVKIAQENEVRTCRQENHILSVQFHKSTEDNRKLEVALQQLKQEALSAQKFIQEKQDEHARTLLQLSTKLQAQTEHEAQIVQQHLQAQLDWSRQIASKESEIKVAQAKCQEIERYWSQNEELQAVKRLREENYNLNTKFVRAETELKSLKHEKKELEIQLKDCRQQKDELIEKLNQKESDHRVALARTQLGGYRMGSSSNGSNGTKL